MNVHELASVELPDVDGVRHRLGDLWRDRPVVLVFLRHFGWLHCREHAAQLAGRYESIRQRGAEVVAIGTGDRRYARRFVEDEAVPFTVLVDDDARAARSAAVEEASWWRLLHPSTWSATRATWSRGHRVHKAGKRVQQLGATFVIGPGDSVRYQHLDPDSVTHAPVDDVLRALESPR